MEFLSFLGLVFIGFITLFIPRTVVACIGAYFFHNSWPMILVWIVLVGIALYADFETLNS